MWGNWRAMIQSRQKCEERRKAGVTLSHPQEISIHCKVYMNIAWDKGITVQINGVYNFLQPSFNQVVLKK